MSTIRFSQLVRWPYFLCCGWTYCPKSLNKLKHDIFVTWIDFDECLLSFSPLSSAVRHVSCWLLCQLSFFSIIGQHFLLIGFEQLLFRGLCMRRAVREIGITRSLIRQPALHQNKHCCTKRSDSIIPTNSFLSPSKKIFASRLYLRQNKIKCLR